MNQLLQCLSGSMAFGIQFYGMTSLRWGLSIEAHYNFTGGYYIEIVDILRDSYEFNGQNRDFKESACLASKIIRRQR